MDLLCVCFYLFGANQGKSGISKQLLTSPPLFLLHCTIVEQVEKNPKSWTIMTFSIFLLAFIDLRCFIILFFSSVQLLSHVRLFATPWIAAPQASLSIANSQSLLKLMSIQLVMPSSHLILCCPLLLLPPIPPTIRVFSKESTLHMRWPKYWSFSFRINPSNEHPGLISFRMDWLDLLAVQGFSKVFSNTTVQKHQFFGTQLSSLSNSHIHTSPLEKP